MHEMCHRLPGPLQDRVFPVLVISAMSSPDSFLTVQIGLDGLERVSGSEDVGRKDVVVGTCTSIEACWRQAGRITWGMTVTSDAKGVLPSWVQTAMIPSAIAKDVGFLMAWVHDRRNGAAASQDDEVTANEDDP